VGRLVSGFRQRELYTDRLNRLLSRVSVSRDIHG
jgi:hypothetical protein